MDEDLRDEELYREQATLRKLVEAAKKVTLSSRPAVWFGERPPFDFDQWAADIIAYVQLVEAIGRKASLEHAVKSHLGTKDTKARRAARALIDAENFNVAALTKRLKDAGTEWDEGSELSNFRNRLNDICQFVYRHPTPPVPLVHAPEQESDVPGDRTTEAHVAGITSEPASVSPAQPIKFPGGVLAFFPDRVELCGIDICSGPRQKRSRQVLDLLRKKTKGGRFESYSGNQLAEATGLEGGQNGAAGLIRDLRRRIGEALQNANLECGPFDVILSGGPGYRLKEWITVQESEQALGRPRNDPNDTGPVGTNEPDDPDPRAKARRDWILGELSQEKKLRAPEVVKHFQCSLATAKRDLKALKDRDKIEFVGPARTGYYRLRGKA